MMNIVNINDKKYTYKRNTNEMSNRRNKQTSNKNSNDYENVNNVNQNNFPNNNTPNIIYVPYMSNENTGKANWLNILSILGGIVTIIGIVVGAVYAVIVPLTNHTNQITILENDIIEVDNKITNLTDDFKDLSEFIYTNNSSSTKDVIPVVFKENYIPKMVAKDEEFFLDTPNWTNDSTDVANNLTKFEISYKVEDLQNNPIITSYTEGNNEIFFYGTYNENNQWIGKCILNVYSGKKLVSIFEGIYNSDGLFSYKRVSCDDGKVWTISDKIVEGDSSRGEIWEYTKNNDYSQEVELSQFDESQILTVNNFLVELDEQIIKYYSGNTSKGEYNDDNGDAYLVKYTDEGYVDILYVGNFYDGEFHDEEGNSWFISLGDTDKEHYYYYKGRFDKGKKVDKVSGNWLPLTKKEINSIIKAKIFKCPLKWYMDEEV